MKSSHDDALVAPALQAMVNALEELLTLRDPAHKVSNGKKIVEQLSKLQVAYHSLDDEAKPIINAHLKQANPSLLRALEKKGSKISKPFELAGELHETLPDELKKLITANPVLSRMQTSAIPSHELPDDDSVVVDSGTMVVNAGKAPANQLGDALASAGRQLDPNVYVLFSSSGPEALQPLEPRAALIEALEILMKTRINKEGILRGEPKPKGYDNAYRETLLRQFHVLNDKRQVLSQLMTIAIIKEKIAKIIQILEDEQTDSAPAMMKIAGKISELIDADLINTLKRTQHADTPRFIK
jgi:hypothetical protein